MNSNHDLVTANPHNLSVLGKVLQLATVLPFVHPKNLKHSAAKIMLHPNNVTDSFTFIFT